MRQLTGKNAKGVTCRPAGAPVLHPLPRLRGDLSGAALVLVVTLLAILLALGLTFLAITRVETQNSTNTLNNTRSDMLADGMIMHAVQKLNEDFAQHPNATSPDHAWRSYYSGAWAAGKPWMTGGASFPLWNAAMPAVDLLNYFQQFPALAAYIGSPAKEIVIEFPDGYRETLYQGPRTRPWLYYPRSENVTDGDPINPIPFDFNANPTAGPRPIIYEPNATLWIDVAGTLTQIDTQNAPDYNLFFFLDMDKAFPANPISFIGDNILSRAQLPFNLPNLYGVPMGMPRSPLFPSVNMVGFPLGTDVDGAMYPKEIVDRWADVDNDGDGLKDSVWIPIGQDIPLSNDGADSDLDGMVDERPDNGFNDDATTELIPSPAPPALPTEVRDNIDVSTGLQVDFDQDEAIESGVFVYHGLGEWVDVDGVLQRLGDGLDNDGVNGVDDAGEDKWFLTSPLPGIRIPVDLNGDGVPGDLVPYRQITGDPTSPIVDTRALMVRMPNIINVTVITVPGNPPTFGTAQLNVDDVDKLDNDYDGLINDYDAYAYFGPSESQIAPFSFEGISIANINGVIEPQIDFTSTAVNQSGPANFYDVWRHPHNWIGGDQSLYATQRSRAYSDMYIDFDPATIGVVEPVTDAFFDPPIGDWLNSTTFFSLNGGPAVTSGFLSIALDPLLELPRLINSIRITHSGEAVSELVGRAAIYVTDESAKVNLNVAGYHTYDDNGGINGVTPAIYRTVHTGPSTAQYDTRFLPDFGATEAQKFYNYLTGAPDDGLADIYDWDNAFPGYGRVDDNGDALLLAFDGIDNDADGYIDEGIRVDGLGSVDIAGTNYVLMDDAIAVANGGSMRPAVTAYANGINYVAEQIKRLGSLEGVDDPGELQQFNPTRNLLAEGIDIGGGTVDAADNDGDGVTNEIGELSDRMFHKKEQMTQLPGIGTGMLADYKNLTTVNSSDKNVTFAKTPEGIRAVTALDMNEATPQQIAQNMMLTGEFAPIIGNDNLFVSGTAEAEEARAFAAGLRQADVSLTAPDPGTPGFVGGMLYYALAPPANMVSVATMIATTDPAIGGAKNPAHVLPADAQLQALQVAANIRDNIDTDHARTLLRTENRTLDVPNINPLTVTLAQLQAEGLDAVPFPFVSDMNDREGISPEEMFSVQAFEDYAKEALGFDIPKGQLQNVDEWWKYYAGQNNGVGGDPYIGPMPLGSGPNGILAMVDGNGVDIPEERRITNAVAGVESIVINELMVRPVRRVEAEAVPDTATGVIPPVTDPMIAATLPPLPPLVTPLSIANFDPAPGVILNAALPSFGIRRTTTNAYLLPTLGIALPQTNWELSDSATYQNVMDILSDKSFLYNTKAENTFNNPNPLATNPLVPVSDIIEFVLEPGVGALQGLPSGRYYLTVNTQDARGNTTIYQANQLEYSIKYIRPDPINPASNRTITEDYLNAIDTYNYLLADPDFETDYFSLYWNALDQDWISGRPGESPGSIFLDGTPRFGKANKATLLNPNINPLYANYDANFPNYFLDGGGVLPTPTNDPANFNTLGFPPLAPPNTSTTHTVFIPEVGSPWKICIAFRINPLHPLYLNTFDHDANVATPEIPDIAPCINFLEFSQEPDHEYIELHNLSDAPVSIAGWHLEIGIPTSPEATNRGVQDDPYRSLWEIPGGIIAPKGYVLLTANKEDRYIAGVAANWIEDNGMGLAGLPIAAAANLSGVTVPPIADMISTSSSATNPELLPFIDPRNYTTSGAAPYNVEVPMSGSVFNPGLSEIPYVDDNGDGVSSVLSLVDAAFNVTTQIPDLDNAKNVMSFDSALAINIPPSARWDRIIQLRNITIDREAGGGAPGDDLPYAPTNNSASLSQYRNLDDIARLVLRGGILPNYPEHDGIDNDGDGAYMLRFGSSYYKYVPGILDKDMVDNNLDGRVDEQDLRANLVVDGWWDNDGWDNDGDGTADNGGEAPVPTWANDTIDNDGDGYINEYDERNLFDVNGTPGNPLDDEQIWGDILLSEGVDEGDYSDWEMDPLGNPGVYYPGFGPGTYDDFSLPVRFYANRETHRTDFADYNLVAKPFSAFHGFDPSTRAIGLDTIGAGFAEVVQKNIDVAPYIGSPMDPPDWKAFVQRKWNPGDNVIVTLYDGDPGWSDPNTRGEVVDRVTYREYDVINRTIDDIADSPYVDTFGNIVSLSADYANFWLPNQMGLDFYRALERKAPTYRGDRFGTSNRWESTDGNYDDWADSLSFFERMVSVAEFPNVQVASVSAGTAVISRFEDTVYGLSNRRTLQHAIWGSPLRMNTAHRMSENPPDMLKWMDYEVTGTPVYATDNMVTPYFDVYYKWLYGVVAAEVEVNSRHPQFPSPYTTDAKIVSGMPSGTLDSTTNSLTPGNYIGGLYLAIVQPNGNVVPEFVVNRDYTYALAKVPNASLGSASDLMSVPFSQYFHQMVNAPLATGESFLFSMQDTNRLNYLETNVVGDEDVFTQHDISQRGQILGVNDGAYQVAQAMLDNAVASFSNDSFTLTVAQADFKPVFGATGADDETDWDRDGTLEAPYAWSPIYLYQLPGDTALFYPVGLDNISGAPIDPVYIFDLVNYFNTGSMPNTMFAGGFVDPILPDYYNRWPLEKRVVMYVSQDDTNLNLPPAEALFTWDAEDGLENGEYTVYVHTFVPGSFANTDPQKIPSVQMARTSAFNAYGEELVTTDATAYVPALVNTTSFETDLLPKDTQQSGQYAFRAKLEMEVIANRADVNANLLNNPLIERRFEADEFGRMMDADKSTYGMQPMVVKVTDNFLALRVRNYRELDAVGNPRYPGISNNIASISHITLSPRKKTPGRININTAETSLTEVGTTYEFFNPLLGLPGVINAYDTVRIPEKFVDPLVLNPDEKLGTPIGSGDDVALPQLTKTTDEWLSPEAFLNGTSVRPSMLLPPTENIQTQNSPPTDMIMPPPASNPLLLAGTDPDAGYAGPNNNEMTALRLMSLIVEGRKEHADGRYYDTKADLLRESSKYVVRRDLTAYPGLVEESVLYPLSNENDPEVRFREVQERYSYMGNLITTRSDTFEIIATVQAGHVDDTNNDGVANYRTADFTIQGETKTRAIYERRTPAGNTTGDN